MNRIRKSIGRRCGYALALMALAGGAANGAVELLPTTTELFPTGSNWNFLHITNNVDPAGSDADFDSTWFKNDGSYNGPAFAGPSAAPFHYGGVDGLTGGTTLPQPASGNRKTAYFTTSFNFAGDPAMVTNLAASLLVDDGAYIYLNGVRVGGHNMAVGGADTFNSFAPGTISETSFANIGLTNNLQTGTNYLAISVHQTNATSSDLGFDIRLNQTSNPLSGLNLTNIVPMGATWSYRDDGTDQGSAWRFPAFDNSSWASGPSELGYGDGDEATEVEFIDTDPVTTGIQRNITTYFIHEFTIDDPQAIEELYLSLLRDDGAVVYLNGVEIIRDNMPGGVIDFNTLAVSVVGTGGEGGEPNQEILKHIWKLSEADLDLLIDGVNRLAVEIHQQSPTSSDISFDLQLDAVMVIPAPAAGWAGLAALSAMGLGARRRSRN